MSMPDLSNLLSHVSASPNAHLPTLVDLVPQGLPSNSSPTTQEPNSHSQADAHAGAGLVDHAADNAHAPSLPDLVSLTGHDWFVHS
jgi:hypothetical protein